NFHLTSPFGQPVRSAGSDSGSRITIDPPLPKLLRTTRPGGFTNDEFDIPITLIYTQVLLALAGGAAR
nr:hypothetical protein [Pyrinomonadaceae bacterium]